MSKSTGSGPMPLLFCIALAWLLSGLFGLWAILIVGGGVWGGLIILQCLYGTTRP